MTREELKRNYADELRKMEAHFSNFQMDEVGRRHLRQFITYA